MDRPTSDHEWKICWYPDGTTAQGCAMIIRIPKEAEGSRTLGETEA